MGREMTAAAREKLKALRNKDRGQKTFVAFRGDVLAFMLDELQELPSRPEGPASFALDWLMGVKRDFVHGPYKIGARHFQFLTDAVKHQDECIKTCPPSDGFGTKIHRHLREYYLHNFPIRLAQDTKIRPILDVEREIRPRANVVGNVILFNWVELRRAREWQLDLLRACMPYKTISVCRFGGIGNANKTEISVFPAYLVLTLFVLLFPPDDNGNPSERFLDQIGKVVRVHPDSNVLALEVS